MQNITSQKSLCARERSLWKLVNIWRRYGKKLKAYFLVQHVYVCIHVYWSHQQSWSTPGPVGTWMGDHWQAGKPSLYVISHPGQLSLAIPPWTGAMSTSENCDINRNTARYISLVSVMTRSVNWCMAKEISANLWALLLGKDFTLRNMCNIRNANLQSIKEEYAVSLSVMEKNLFNN